MAQLTALIVALHFTALTLRTGLIHGKSVAKGIMRKDMVIVEEAAALGFLLQV